MNKLITGWGRKNKKPVVKKPSYIPPSDKGFTIYSITECKYCSYAIKLLNKKGKTCKIVKCDDYIKRLRDYDAFNNFMIKYTKKPYPYFPKIFSNGKFIGGYKELQIFLNKS